VVQRDDWTVITRPPQISSIQTYAVDAAKPSVMYVSDERSLLRSSDGGCTWARVFSVGDIPPVDTGAAHAAPILRQVVSAEGTRRVWITIEQSGTDVVPQLPQVISSFDDGESWTSAVGLPPVGSPRLLRVAPSNPDVLYLTLFGVGGSVLAASSDGGRSWEIRQQGNVPERFVVDPQHPGELWGLSPSSSTMAQQSPLSPSHSVDGGRRWTWLAGAPAATGQIVDLAVFRRAGDNAVVVLPESWSSGRSRNGVRVWRSADGGGSFAEMGSTGLSGGVAEVAFGRESADDVVLTASRSSYGSGARGSVLRWDGRAWLEADKFRLSPLFEPAGTSLRDAAWFFRSTNAIASLRKPAPGTAAAPAAPEPTPELPPVKGCLSGNAGAPARPAAKSSLSPAGTDVQPQPGKAVTVPYSLSLPAAPAALDVYFLLDTSGSMGSALDGIVCGLERLKSELTSAGVDLHLGLGEFQDANGIRYRRILDLAPPGPELERALRAIRLNGGEETHRSALYQTATGEGLSYPVGGQIIRPGQQAGYRENALKVVMMITDEPYQETTMYEPPILGVIEALSERSIHHVGIHVYGGQGTGLDSTVVNDLLIRRQLEQISGGTRTFAPAAGVDCDGDGNPDVRSGAPLVCSVKRSGIEANLGETLISVLLAVQEAHEAFVKPAATNGVEVSVSPASRTVNVHSDYTEARALAFDVSFTCPEYLSGQTWPVKLQGFVGDVPVATATASVACGPQALGFLSPLTAAAPAVAPAAPPPLAPAPAQAPAPGQAPVGANAPVTAAQVAPAVPESAPAPALAAAPNEVQVRPAEVKVTDSRRFSDNGWAARTAAAGGVAFAFALALARREKARATRPALASSRRARRRGYGGVAQPPEGARAATVRSPISNR
jgi:hypothetical protein